MTVAAVNQRGLPRTARSADPTTLGGTGGVTVEQVYDASGRQVATRYVGEATWSCTAYDGRGRVTAQAVPAFGGQPARSVTTTYGVGGDPLLTKVEDPAGAITTRVDLLGRVTDTVDVWGIHTHTDYDAAGRVSQATVFRSTGAVLERVMFDYAATGAGVNQLAAQRFSAAAATVSGHNFSTLTASTPEAGSELISATSTAGTESSPALDAVAIQVSTSEPSSSEPRRMGSTDGSDRHCPICCDDEHSLDSRPKVPKALGHTGPGCVGVVLPAVRDVALAVGVPSSSACRARDLFSCPPTD